MESFRALGRVQGKRNHGDWDMKKLETKGISRTSPTNFFTLLIIAFALVAGVGLLPAQERDGAPPQRGATSYDQIAPALVGKESFEEMRAKDKAGKAAVMARQQQLLAERYEL